MKLTMHPFGEEELNQYISSLPDRNARMAYNEILRKVRNNPENSAFYTYWSVENAGTVIGGVLFYGIPNARHEAAVSYGIEDEYKTPEIEEEVISMIKKWIFHTPAVIEEGGKTIHRRCYYLRIKNEISDVEGRKLLERLGFRMLEPDENNPESAYCILFEQEAPKLSFTTIGLLTGLCLGVLIAWIYDAVRLKETLELSESGFSPFVLCSAIGLVVGIGLGYTLDAIEKRKRKRV